MAIRNRFIQVYETDMMGIVHHSNYLRLCEEARVQWFMSKNVLGVSKEDVFALTVVSAQVLYKKSLKYADLANIDLQLKTEGARFFIQYKIFNQKNELCVLAETIHCSMDLNFKPTRLSAELINTVKKEASWKETWL